MRLQDFWIVAAVLICCRVLYLLELLPVRGGHRVGFVGSLCGERTRCNAVFTRCNGYMRRVVRLQGGKTYRFDMGGKISHGQLNTILWDPKCRTRLLELQSGEQKEIKIEETARYRLELRFESASGNFTLSWNEE